MIDQHEPGTLRSDLVRTVYRAWVLNGYLEEEVAEPVGRGIGSGGGSKPSGSRIPWNTQAAELVMDLYSASRELETVLNLRTVGRQPVRGRSSRNTWLALYHVTDLAETVTDKDVLSALLTLRKWVARAEVTLGQAEPIRRIPREYGKEEPCCPWCCYMTLRCRVTTGTVFCVNPGCLDNAGNRPVASVEFGDLGELLLVWQDGAHRIPVPYREETA